MIECVGGEQIAPWGWVRVVLFLLHHTTNIFPLGRTRTVPFLLSALCTVRLLIKTRGVLITPFITKMGMCKEGYAVCWWGWSSAPVQLPLTQTLSPTRCRGWEVRLVLYNA